MVNPNHELQRFSGALLHCLHISSHLPWLVTGDFNKNLALDEKTGRARKNWHIDMYAAKFQVYKLKTRKMVTK